VTPDLDLSALGIAVGHATDEAGGTGVTVVRGVNGPLRAGVALFGRATGSRELHTASAEHLVGGRIDAIMLTGGSAYGLDAAAGVMRWMEERGQGFNVGPGVVPIVPAAVVFDLLPFGRFDARPTPQMAYEACESAATKGIAEGSVGAGTGTTVGHLYGPAGAMKGGFGGATITNGDGRVTVGAVAVVNAFGDVRDGDGLIIAGARARRGFADMARVMLGSEIPPPAAFGELKLKNTTLCVVASSVPLAAASLTQLARAAGAALFRRITPVGTSFDGDVVFAVSPCEGEPSHLANLMIESLGVAALEQAIERAVRTARGRDGIPGLADGY